MPHTLNLLFRLLLLPLITLEGKERTFTIIDPKEILPKKKKIDILSVL